MTWPVGLADDQLTTVYKGGCPAIRGRRTDLIERSGQKTLPVVELPGGAMVREESERLAERIRSGELGERLTA